MKIIDVSVPNINGQLAVRVNANIIKTTSKAALVSIDEEPPVWIPLSLMRDNGDSIDLIQWFYDKYVNDL